MPQLRIGISGWRYKPWRGTFYPTGLAQRRELEFASRKLNSIELNGSFYSLQRPASYLKWKADTPDDFVFSIKGNRYLTHIKRLTEIDQTLANFLASGVLALEEKLGPFLWQFHPSMKFDADKFTEFFEKLPHTNIAAAQLAEHHDEFMKDRVWLTPTQEFPLRHAVEIRHESFRDPAFIKLLRKHKIALVVADTAAKWPFLEDVTTDFIYARLHGDAELYVSGYTAEALDIWAQKIRKWSAGTEPLDAKKVIDTPPTPRKSRDIYIYFDNDLKVRAPNDAQSLMQRLDVHWNPPEL